MNNLSVENYVRPKLELPNNGKNLLLHSCCAPCAGEIMEAIAASNIETTIYFYNPNIPVSYTHLTLPTIDPV